MGTEEKDLLNSDNISINSNDSISNDNTNGVIENNNVFLQYDPNFYTDKSNINDNISNIELSIKKTPIFQSIIAEKILNKSNNYIDNDKSKIFNIIDKSIITLDDINNDINNVTTIPFEEENLSNQSKDEVISINPNTEPEMGELQTNQISEKSSSNENNISDYIEPVDNSKVIEANQETTINDNLSSNVEENNVNISNEENQIQQVEINSNIENKVLETENKEEKENNNQPLDIVANIITIDDINKQLEKISNEEVEETKVEPTINNEKSTLSNKEIIYGIPEITNINNGESETSEVQNQSTDIIDSNLDANKKTLKKNGKLLVILPIIVIGILAILYFTIFNKKHEILFCEETDKQIHTELRFLFIDDYFENGTMTESVDVSELSEEEYNMTKDWDLCDDTNILPELIINSCKQSETNKIITRVIEIKPSSKELGKDIKKAKETFEKSGLKCEIIK